MKVFSNKVLLITRPLNDSVAFSKHLKKMDATIATICSPLFEIQHLAISHDLSTTQGLIITSSNAIRSLIRAGIKFDGPTFCVGNSTALLAQKAGYCSVSSDGNVGNLFELIKRSVSENFTKLTYFRGEEVSGDLGSSLREKNYDVEEIICYRKLPNNISSKIIHGIKNGLILGATFFSKETVRLFFYQVKDIPDNFVAFCISEEVSMTISSLYPKSCFSVRVAKKPTAFEMSKLIVAAKEFAI